MRWGFITFCEGHRAPSDRARVSIFGYNSCAYMRDGFAVMETQTSAVESNGNEIVHSSIYYTKIICFFPHKKTLSHHATSTPWLYADLVLKRFTSGGSLKFDLPHSVALKNLIPLSCESEIWTHGVVRFILNKPLKMGAFHSLWGFRRNFFL